MRLKRGTTLLAVLLTALSLTGCRTDDSAVEGSSTAAPWWKGSSPAADGVAPSFDSVANSAPQTSGIGTSPRQTETKAIQDTSIAKTVDAIAAVSKPGNHSYRIGPLDVLDISVYQAPDLSKTVEVSETGTVDLPLIGETPAAGKTAQELQRDLNQRLGAKYLQNPQVTVLVKEFNSNRVTVSGAVKNPGVFPYKGETLLQFVAMAGGLAPESDSMVLVLRNNGGKRLAAKFNVNQIQAGDASDPTMQSGDVIVADTSAMKRGFNNILKVLPLASFAALL
jgi:polysaccharide export outer membrane protein